MRRCELDMRSDADLIADALRPLSRKVAMRGLDVVGAYVCCDASAMEGPIGPDRTMATGKTTRATRAGLQFTATSQ
jgi:hypothetical protein